MPRVWFARFVIVLIGLGIPNGGRTQPPLPRMPMTAQNMQAVFAENSAFPPARATARYD